MLSKIRTFFDTHLDQAAQQDDAQAVNLAACALLFEMVKADYSISAAELAAMRHAIKSALDIDDAAADTLIKLAEEETQEATSLYPFTRLINDHYSSEQKARLTRALWLIAFADGEAHKYEEHYLRKLAGLLYVPHSTVIQTKLEVQRSSKR